MPKNKITRFAIFGFKGGVGKSTIAYFLAKDLSKKYRVLLVDRDYTNTIGKIFGLETGLINVLVDGVEGRFTAQEGNLRVTSLATFQPTSLPPIEKFARAYSEILDGIDVVITDNAPNFDTVTEIEAKGYYKATDEFHCNSILVTTPGVALRLTLEHANEIPSVLRSWVPETSYTRLAAFVINMARGEVEAEVPRKVVIPFYREMLFRGFSGTSKPKEMEQLVKLVEEVIRGRD